MEPSTAQLLGTLTQTGGIVLACWKVVSELDSWRREYLGKRRTDLAEEVLVAFHKVHEALLRVRFPPYVAKTLEQAVGPIDAVRQFAEVTQEKLEESRDLFKQFEALKYRFLAHFPESKARPFQDVANLVSSIEVNCMLLLKTTIALQPDQVKTFRDSIVGPDTDEAAANDVFTYNLKQAERQLVAVLSPHMAPSRGLFETLTRDIKWPWTRK